MSTQRDIEREGAWLERAALDSRSASFAEHATTRLAAGVDAYGDRWTQLGLARLLTELTEEAADLGAWGVLALQSLEREDALRADDRESIADRLLAVMLSGARAHHDLERARREYERAVAAHHHDLERRRDPDRAIAATFMPDVDGRCLNCGRTYSAHAENTCRPVLEPARGMDRHVQ